MKKALLLIISSLYFSAAQAQRLSVSKTTVDVGRTGYEMPVTATFELRNKGLRKLVIHDVKADCYCTKVEFPKDEIGAGDKFTIRMTYDARQLGHFNKQAAILSNGSKTPVYITMTGVVLADMKDWSGSYPYDYNGLLGTINNLEFDNVNKGEQCTFEMLVMNNGTQPMRPNVLHLPAYLTAKAYPETLAPGHGGKVVFTLHSEKIHNYGLTQTSVYLAQQLGEKVSADNEMPVSVILLPDLKAFEAAHNTAAPKLQMSSTEIDFTDFGGKSKKTAEITLVNTGSSRFTVSSLQMFTSGLKVTLGKRELAPGQSTTLKVVGYAADLAKVRTRPRILMITNDPDHSKVVVNIKK